ncbi:Methionine adenosyltransferase 2 subunit beta [Ameca splendens]|uniref:Methionine adenosyltransferase 2 subunit beta n=2 Tax=Goodeidae TaxID=28758 RepID=A0ABV0YIK0_9TELE
MAHQVVQIVQDNHLGALHGAGLSGTEGNQEEPWVSGTSSSSHNPAVLSTRASQRELTDSKKLISECNQSYGLNPYCFKGPIYVVILRVPVLFGEAESVMESAVTSLWQKVQEATEESCPLDHCLQRFPTDTRDVATVCRKLAERARQDPSIRGIFHFSGKEQMTKYEMAVAIAQAFNLPSNHLIPLTEQPAGSAPRPINSQLNCSRLELLNLSVDPRAFSTAITECLWPFTADKRWRQTVFH